ncbi:protein C3orf33 homolog isoform X4 [Clytia hemisphaerica]
MTVATGCIGIILITRRYHLMKRYRHVSEIPKEFITKKVFLRGKLERIEVCGTLLIQHSPILSFGFSKGSPSLRFSLAGVELQNGWYEHLQELQHKNILFQILQKNDKELKGVLFYKRGWLSKEMNVNEDLVGRGLAITRCNIPSPLNVFLYQELMERLLKVELQADKKGIGIWRREREETFIKRLIGWVKRKLQK